MWLAVSFFGGMAALWLILWGQAIWDDRGANRFDGEKR